MDKYMRNALELLYYLRRGTDQYWSFLIYLRNAVRDGGLCLADIGTSEEELDELQVKGCIINSKEILGHLRRGTEQSDEFISFLRMEILKGEVSLDDIGTSEEELASFTKVSVLSQ